MFDFSIAETKSFEKIKKSLDPKLYKKIVGHVYPQLRSNPFYGANIKKLKGEYEGYYRFRIGNYRLFYLVEYDQVLVVVTDLRNRQNAYD